MFRNVNLFKTELNKIKGEEAIQTSSAEKGLLNFAKQYEVNLDEWLVKP